MKNLFRVFLILLLPAWVEASITLSDETTISLTKNSSSTEEGAQWLFSVTSYIRNVGLSKVSSVSPEFRFGSLIFEGEKVGFRNRKTHKFELAKSFSLEEVACQGQDCVGRDLPLVGRFPVYFLLHYQDLNGYPFSRPSVISLNVQTESEPTLKDLNGSEVALSLSVQRADGDFIAQVEVNNTSDSEKEVVLTAFSSNELEIENSQKKVSVRPGGRVLQEFPFQNKSGLAFSIYSFYVVAEFETGGYRDHSVVSARFKIPEKKPLNYWPWVLGFTVLMGGAIFYYVEKGVRNSHK